MDNAEKRQLEEIDYYKEQLLLTNSDKRKRDIEKCIKCLEKELAEYRHHRYGVIKYR